MFFSYAFFWTQYVLQITVGCHFLILQVDSGWHSHFWPMSILNGEILVDVLTVTLHARRTRLRLKFKSSDCVALVMAFIISMRMRFVPSTFPLPCGYPGDKRVF